ncbi:geranylgeranyl pyrophosphate synthase [Streptomyces avermitilis]|uniref:Geranylgeranyl diphosphate synthase n=2 Tax=Streptomyces avermitilis TaxID=33903 RepID=Q79ZL1_STRAW|nr:MULTISPECIES: polyprenyl synthetase family protein [Streptomyces]KUN54852.1 geranylgeranyl pyrophosphate synthase [Streptomyces avermitilis]MYS96654.1 polyprenyl synthetase family protein [Streptomyces sp. SID5469]OOV21495.1 geranylgeranyl pyrophosphate synthase [Streptomyces avermitilis]BAC68732.2 geranylgeranyl diphosphate synthase [Streptomyces avermitilis MA-4680 = NBRC 14893]GDY60685.1 geranylgeranyl pyrophosphate synthase [Streptomyces avermitilis]
MRRSKATDHQAAGPSPGPRDAFRPASVDEDVPAAVGRLLDRFLAERVARAAALDPVFAHDIAERVARFTLDGGKRTRSQFVWWAHRACGGPAAGAEAALRVGAALELIQTCALVHDDVMDGSRLRRGRPALHTDVSAQYADAVLPAPGTRFGEAAAILAGDLALAWADDVVADTDLAPDPGRRVREVWSCLRMEMVAGQYLDIQGQATSSHSEARAMRAACLKSALYSVQRPLELGAALAGADTATTQALCSAGRCVGLAFQLRDDLHDVFEEPRRTGKPSGGDIRAGKPTYLVAVARARAEAAGDRGALAVLRRSLGCADLSDADLARVRDVLVTTGARDTVEAEIDRLVAQGLRHMGAASLAPEGRRHLDALLRSAAGAPSVRRQAPDASRSENGMPVSLLLTATAEGASR